MPAEMEKLIASLLRPRASGANNESVERLDSFEDSSTVTDSLTTTSAAPERRAGLARVGYSEVG